MPPGGSPATPPMPGVPGGNPNDPQPGAGGNLAGTTWSGSETLRGFGALTFQFNPGGQAVMIDAAGRTEGTWNQNGNNVTLTIAGTVTYTGTIQGNAMRGNATNGNNNWNWTVTRGAGGGANNNPGGYRPPPPGAPRPPQFPGGRPPTGPGGRPRIP